MGEKKARLEASVRKAAEIEEYIRNYLYSLRALMRKSPNIETIFTSKGMAVIGKAEIWPCQDGAVVLIYQDPNEKIEVVTNSRVPSSPLF